MAEKKYLSLDGLQLYDQLIKSRIDEGDAKALKTVALSADGKKLLFYNVPEPVGTTTPLYEIEFPDDDSKLDAYMKKVATALNGNIGVFQNGSIVDSGKSFSDYYTKTEVAEEIAKSSKLEKRIVSTLPPVAEAQSNIIYMLKDATATGDDKYKEYTLIDGQLVMIGDTSVDLSGYVKNDDLTDITDGIKSDVMQDVNDAIDDKIGDAKEDILADANRYTDQEVGKVNQSLATTNQNVVNNTSSITTINQTLDTHGDQISDLTTIVNNLDTIDSIPEADIRALFPSN